MKWYEDYYTFFSLFEIWNSLIDDTLFIFQPDPEKTEHNIGYSPQYENPIGLENVMRQMAVSFIQRRVVQSKKLQWEVKKGPHAKSDP